MNELTNFITLTTFVYVFSGAVTMLAVLCGSLIVWFKKQEPEFNDA